jgi:hypothetical protein
MIVELAIVYAFDLYIAVDKVSCPVLADLLRILRLSRFEDEISRFLDISLLEWKSLSRLVKYPLK